MKTINTFKLPNIPRPMDKKEQRDDSLTLIDFDLNAYERGQFGLQPENPLSAIYMTAYNMGVKGVNPFAA